MLRENNEHPVYNPITNIDVLPLLSADVLVMFAQLGGPSLLQGLHQIRLRPVEESVASYVLAGHQRHSRAPHHLGLWCGCAARKQ